MRSLLKALLTTGGATLVGQFLSLIVNKILALTVGTAGIGFYSLTRQVHETAVSFGSIGAGGLVQGLAAREGAARRRLFHGALLLTACGAAAMAALLLLFPARIGALLFDRSDAAAVATVMLCALTAALGIAYAMLNAVVNAARAIVTLALLGIGGAAVAAILAWPVAQAAGAHPQALTALIGVPLAVQAVAAWFVLRRMGWWQGGNGRGENRPGAAEFRYFAGFFGFNVALGAIATGTMLYLRAGIVHADGLAAAGLFAAAWGIGMQSMSLVLASFGTYVLPTVAAATPELRCKNLQDAATLVTFLTLPLLCALLALKPLVVALLFAESFLPAIELLQWLLAGSYLKAMSWVMAMPLLATADLRRYFALEAGWYAIFLAGAATALGGSGWLGGIGMAFVAAYVAHLLAASWLAHSRFGFRLSPRSAAVFALGGAIVFLTAWMTWDEADMRWWVALAMPAVAAAVGGLGLTPQHRRRGFELALRAVGR